MALHENSKILSISVGCLLLLVEKHLMIQELIPKFKEWEMIVPSSNGNRGHKWVKYEIESTDDGINEILIISGLSYNSKLVCPSFGRG